jgi:acyl-CoA synthetase (AMP-forming)/AMP-acid ligase II
VTVVETGRELWHRRCRESADRPFLHVEGHTWTVAEFDEAQRRFAAGLVGLGVRRGDRVLLGMSNRAETLMLLFAVQELGAVAVPLQGELTVDELAFRIEHSGGVVLVADGAVGGSLVTALDRFPRLTAVVLDGVPPGVEAGRATVVELDALGRTAPLDPPLPGYSDRDPALVLYTSGSTGRPKGVVLGAGVFPSAGRAFAEHFGITESDNYFLPLTMGHAIGALVAPAIATWTGGALTIVDRFSPSRFWQQVAEHEATVSILFPAHLNLLMETQQKAPPAGAIPMRHIITHVWMEAFRQRFGVELSTVWGMTETGALCSGSEPGYRGQWEGYVGTPMAGVEIGVFDESFTRLGPGDIGEIALRHDQVMLGYLDDPEATATTLVDGWIRSGDYGEVDEEGRLFFRGRLKNMIKRSGENISPEEVENVLIEHPDVVECLVFGVPDAIRTEEVAAVVVTRGAVAPEDVLEFAATRLTRLKLPRYLVVDSEPLARLGNGKIDRPGIKRGFHVQSAWDRQDTGAVR